MKLSVASLILIGILGCTDGTGPLAGSLTYQVTPPTVQLNNTSSAPVYTFLIERETAAVTNWAPCTNRFQCPSLAPGEAETLPYSAIAGYKVGAKQAILYWWHLVASDGPGLRPDSVRGVVLDL